MLLDGFQGEDFPLSPKMQKELWVIKELFRQQEIMYRTKTHSIPHRIVSISQPHVRPIVRGKAKAKTEFGAKISVSIIDDKVYMDRLSWDAYNESEDLIPAVERYKDRFGYYPEDVNADKIYWNQSNRKYLQKLGINMYGGSPLGRPTKSKTAQEKKHHKHQSVKRNRIEGVFGLGKRRFGLGLVMAKTRNTSESWIAMVIFIINVAEVYRGLIFSYFYGKIRIRSGSINSTFLHTTVKFDEKWITYWKAKTLTTLTNESYFQKPAF